MVDAAILDVQSANAQVAQAKLTLSTTNSPQTTVN